MNTQNNNNNNDTDFVQTEAITQFCTNEIRKIVKFTRQPKRDIFALTINTVIMNTKNSLNNIRDYINTDIKTRKENIFDFTVYCEVNKEFPDCFNLYIRLFIYDT
jgi:hypothetical protein